MASETDFKQWFRREWPCWLESYEPRRGGGTGIADIQVVVKSRLVPIELKVGKVDGPRVYPSEVRADQIGWHTRLAQAGVDSYLLIGVKERLGWRMFLVSAEEMRHWREGYLVRHMEVADAAAIVAALA